MEARRGTDLTFLWIWCGALSLSLPVCAMMARKATGERGECDGEGEKAEKTGEGQTGCCSLPPFLPLYSPAPKVDKQSDAAAMCIIFGARGLNHENSIKEMESRSQYTRLDKEDRR